MAKQLDRSRKSKFTTEQRLNPVAPESFFSFGVAFWVGAVLCGSGIVHLGIFAILGASWHGPLSLRKPMLFGISGGLTAWSIGWLMTQLRPMKYDRFLVGSISFALLVEVALITIQYWRGVASHFNHATNLDAAIEFTMLALILLASCAILYLSVRTFRLRDEIEPAMATAIRGGMWLLSLSCGLGIVTSVLGELSISQGASYELWGKAGVLKFPHGVALHSIQLLPIIAWLVRVLKLAHSLQIVRSALLSQVLFLGYAVWQTSQGRDRFDWDTIGACVLSVSLLSGCFPTIAIATGFLRSLRSTS